MEEVLEVYARPYDEKNPVVCFDESPKQLVSELRQSYDKGVKYEDCEYKREGAADIFMITEPLGGRRKVLVEESHTGIKWAETMGYIVEQIYPKAEKVTLVNDNLSSHKLHNLYKVYEPKRARAIIDRLELVYTPKHGSWLNIAECELSVLSRQALNKRFATKEELEAQVKAWSKNRNNAQKGVDWQFKTKLANDYDQEPTRSILFRSAANLLLNLPFPESDHFRQAEKMVAYGLSGNPPEEIAKELRGAWRELVGFFQQEAA